MADETAVQAVREFKSIQIEMEDSKTGRTRKMRFDGDWLVGNEHLGEEHYPERGNDGGACYSVALTKKGYIAVFCFHTDGMVAESQTFDSFEDLQDDEQFPQSLALPSPKNWESNTSRRWTSEGTLGGLHYCRSPPRQIEILAGDRVKVLRLVFTLDPSTGISHVVPITVTAAARRRGGHRAAFSRGVASSGCGPVGIRQGSSGPRSMDVFRMPSLRHETVPWGARRDSGTQPTDNPSGLRIWFTEGERTAPARNSLDLRFHHAG